MSKLGEKLKAAKDNLDPVQDNCKYGFVLPDRCRYTAHLGCDCGAYPPLVWDGDKYVSPREMVHK